MEQRLCDVANGSPDAIAVQGENVSLTYHELITQADIVVRALQDKGLESEESVCILLGPGAEQTVVQVAVIRAGGTCVPLDPGVPDIMLKDMLREIGLRVVITTKELASRVEEFEIILTEENPSGKAKMDANQNVSIIAGCDENHRSHILHTSGTTGKPKGVQIPSKAILHLATCLPVSVKATDNVSLFNNPGFDLSLFEMWVSLLSGATVVPIPKTTLTDPFGIKDFLKAQEVTVMIITTSLFNAIMMHSSPDVFGPIRHMIVAGEVPNAMTMRKALESNSPPKNLWNGYGPTEATCVSTLHRVTIEETQRETISAGAPVGQTKLYLLNRDDEKPVYDKEKPAEICIGGPGLSAGYIGRPKENDEKFIEINISGSEENRSPSPADRSPGGKTVRLYRTGDLGKWRESGKIVDYVGRTDNQVKHRGYRIELEQIEKVLEKHERVKAATVLQLQLDKSSMGKDFLAAFIIMEGEEANNDESTLNCMIEWLSSRLPPYMLPDTILQTSEFPRTPYGKVDRKALEEEARHRLSQKGKSDPEALKDSVEYRISGERDHERASNDFKGTLEKLHLLLQEIHPMAENFGPDDDLESLGLSSLDTAHFLGLINNKIRPLSMDQFRKQSTFSALAQLLSYDYKANYGPLELLQFEEDSHLADEFELIPNWKSEGRVFMTGGTGFLGGQILYRLLKMPNIKQVACLARGYPNKGISPLDRIRKNLERYDLWDEVELGPKLQKMVIALDGDITRPQLGMKETDYQWLVNWAPVVFHIAAKVNWCEPYKTHFAPNVIGTKNALRVAVDGRRKAFHYISSIDIWGVSGFILGTRAVSEDGPLKVHLASLAFDTGYAQSQWVADEMVQRLQNRGLPVTIYRPGFVVGDSKTAVGNPDDFFSRMVIGCIQLGYWPELPEQNMEFVTVDYVCDALLYIASNNDNVGRRFNLTSPDPQKITNMDRLHRLINEAGYPVKMVPYDDWIGKLKSWKALKESPLFSLMPLLTEPILRGATRLQTSKYSPTYECPNTLKVLADRPDIQFTRLSPELIKRFIEFWIKKGFHRI
ncbi:hypothetical protein ETB97_009116 [Aspergillus alliaceus]|uniref:Carrier domain-containing protein n=1 Tax=Petromyces alliaceus TaxID=209559 RepID=A0A8H6E0V5_PETAA|nr:hypothetical protein ETB97_009116 [Aspergillus burnettii]